MTLNTRRVDPQAPIGEAAPGLERLGFGLSIASNFVLAVCLALFVTAYASSPRPALDIAAWVLLILVTALEQTAACGVFRRPRWWYGVTLGVFGVVLLLSCAGAWAEKASTPIGQLPLTAVGVGAVLMMYAMERDLVGIVVPTGVLGLLLVADLLVDRPEDATLYGPRILLVCAAVLPPLVSAQIVWSFKAMLEYQSDLSQAQSATSTPGLGFGLVASEQLAQLDLRAEQLLDDVATGRETLPLSARSAELAGTIATQLRVSLIARKGETWLRHALGDSAVVGAISTVDDPDGLAALLAPDQRDGLLSAIWMFAGGGARQAQRITIAIRRSAGTGARTQRLAITLELAGVPKRGVDPAAWQAISRVGPFTDRTDASTLTISVDCALDVVADR